MGVLDKLFKKKGGDLDNSLPRTIKEFVTTAVKSPANYQIKISEFADLNFALVNGLKKQGLTDPKVIALLDSKMIGICPECYTIYNGEWLSYVATLKESGLASKTIGMSSDTVRFLKGKCHNPDCNCREILILWGPDAETPIYIVTEALKDKVVEVRKAAAGCLGEIKPDASGYHDPNFVRTAVSALTKVLKDEDKDVRKAAKEALDKIKSKKSGK